MSGPVVIASLEKNRRERVRVALDQYKGVNLVDLRITVEMSEVSGLQSPTTKGVCLNVEKLPELIAGLQAAEAKALEMGWIIGGAA